MGLCDGEGIGDCCGICNLLGCLDYYGVEVLCWGLRGGVLRESAEVGGSMELGGFLFGTKKVQYEDGKSRKRSSLLICTICRDNE